MSFKPLKDDAQLQAALDLLSRVSERCATATQEANRALRKNGSADPARPKLLQAVEAANRDRKHAKQQILTLINERVSTAYNAGLTDGTTQAERQGHP